MDFYACEKCKTPYPRGGQCPSHPTIADIHAVERERDAARAELAKVSALTARLETAYEAAKAQLDEARELVRMHEKNGLAMQEKLTSVRAELADYQRLVEVWRKRSDTKTDEIEAARKRIERLELALRVRAIRFEKSKRFGDGYWYCEICSKSHDVANRIKHGESCALATDVRGE